MNETKIVQGWAFTDKGIVSPAEGFTGPEVYVLDDYEDQFDFVPDGNFSMQTQVLAEMLRRKGWVCVPPCEAEYVRAALEKKP